MVFFLPEAKRVLTRSVSVRSGAADRNLGAFSFGRPKMFLLRTFDLPEQVHEVASGLAMSPKWNTLSNRSADALGCLPDRRLTLVQDAESCDGSPESAVR